MEETIVNERNRTSHERTESHSSPLTTNALYSCLVASLGTMAGGCVVAYSSPAVPNLNSHLNPFHLTCDEQTWFASIFALGALFGSLVSSVLMDYFGRKLAIMLSVLPAVTGWIVIIASPNVAVFYVGRIVTGFSKGLFSGITRVYIAEIAPQNMRGMLIAVASVANVLGNLYEYCLGYVIAWTWLAIANAAVPTLLICLVCFLPESPRYLVLKGKKDEAEAVLVWLRDNYKGISEEIRDIEKNITTLDSIIVWKELMKPFLLKKLLVCLGLFTMQQLSGNMLFRLYTVTIFEGMETLIDSNILSIVLGLVGVAGTLSSTVLIDLIGRKTLLVASSLLMAVCLTAAGVYFKISETNEEYALAYIYWIPVISCVLNNFSYSFAFDPVPWIITSELFPTQTRGAAISVVGIWQNICCFVVTKFFFNISDFIHYYGLFWILGAICVIGAIVMCIFLPETKKQSLEKITQGCSNSSAN